MFGAIIRKDREVVGLRRTVLKHVDNDALALERRAMDAIVRSEILFSF